MEFQSTLSTFSLTSIETDLWVVHDFFTPQPVKNASSLLTHLRDAATPDTKLIIFDPLMPYACHDANASGQDTIPALSLPNFDAANEMCYTVDMTVASPT